MKTIGKNIFLILMMAFMGSILFTHVHAGVIPLMTVQPQQFFIRPYPGNHKFFSFFIGAESLFRVRGFLDDDNDDIVDVSGHCIQGNPLQLWQKEQNFIAAFKGSVASTDQAVQELLLQVQNGVAGGIESIFIPKAHFAIPFNLFCGMQFSLPHDIIFGVYIPYRIVTLNNVEWRPRSNEFSIDQANFLSQMLKDFERLSGMKLQGWRRHGFGDLLVQFDYYFHRPQYKEYLKNVGIDIRAGFLFPTGNAEDNNILFGVPLGFDGGCGIVAGARLELWFIHNIRFGIDIELLHLFGNVRSRRIKTDVDQTDLLFLSQTCVYKEPGLIQDFILFADYTCGSERNYFIRALYEFKKQNEDKIFLCSEVFDVSTAQSAEIFQEKTVHSLMVQFSYERAVRENLLFGISSFYRWGFNGKRSLVGDSIGIKYEVSF